MSSLSLALYVSKRDLNSKHSVGITFRGFYGGNNSRTNAKLLPVSLIKKALIKKNNRLFTAQSENLLLSRGIVDVVGLFKNWNITTLLFLTL